MAVLQIDPEDIERYGDDFARWPPWRSVLSELRGMLARAREAMAPCVGAVRDVAEYIVRDYFDERDLPVVVRLSDIEEDDLITMYWVAGYYNTARRTLYIFTFNVRSLDELVFVVSHEVAHAKQHYRYGDRFLDMYYKYSERYGYYDNPFQVEANDYAYDHAPRILDMIRRGEAGIPRETVVLASTFLRDGDYASEVVQNAIYDLYYVYFTAFVDLNRRTGGRPGPGEPGELRESRLYYVKRVSDYLEELVKICEVNQRIHRALRARRRGPSRASPP